MPGGPGGHRAVRVRRRERHRGLGRAGEPLPLRSAQDFWEPRCFVVSMVSGFFDAGGSIGTAPRRLSAMPVRVRVSEIRVIDSFTPG